jgi:hypothetical protein
LFLHPIDDRVFDAGRGKGGRVLAHLDSASNPTVARTIDEIRAAGEEPWIEILVHGLPDG